MTIQYNFKTAFFSICIAILVTLAVLALGKPLPKSEILTLIIINILISLPFGKENELSSIKIISIALLSVLVNSAAYLLFF